MSLIGARSVAAAAALQPLGLSLLVSPDEFVITVGPDDKATTVAVCKSIDEVDAFIADHRRVAAAPQPAAPLKPLRYAPGATAVLEAHGFRVGDEFLTPSELRERGFTRVSDVSFDSDWVQANGFQVRGLIRQGDAQRFRPDELRDLVAAFFAERGVEVEHPGMLEAFCFSIDPDTPGLDLDKAREQAAADMAAVAAPLKPAQPTSAPRCTTCPTEARSSPTAPRCTRACAALRTSPRSTTRTRCLSTVFRTSACSS